MGGNGRAPLYTADFAGFASTSSITARLPPDQQLPINDGDQRGYGFGISPVESRSQKSAGAHRDSAIEKPSAKSMKFEILPSKRRPASQHRLRCHAMARRGNQRARTAGYSARKAAQVRDRGTLAQRGDHQLRHALELPLRDPVQPTLPRASALLNNTGRLEPLVHEQCSSWPDSRGPRPPGPQDCMIPQTPCNHPPI